MCFSYVFCSFSFYSLFLGEAGKPSLFWFGGVVILILSDVIPVVFYLWCFFVILGFNYDNNNNCFRVLEVCVVCYWWIVCPR